jgi:hypothetical protein
MTTHDLFAALSPAMLEKRQREEAEKPGYFATKFLPNTAPEARAARDKALKKVVANAGQQWQAEALDSLRYYAKTHGNIIAEDFRVWWLRRGNDKPHHHNAWGALFRIAAQQGWLEMTNTIRSMSTVRSHARKSPVWRYKEGA